MNRLIEVSEVDEEIEDYLGRQGRIFEAFRQQDSGCVSYGVLMDGRRWFVKHSDEAKGIAGLRRAHKLHGAVDHPALARLHNSFKTAGGQALVYEWLLGEVLYDYTAGKGNRDDPAGAHTR